MNDPFKRFYEFCRKLGGDGASADLVDDKRDLYVMTCRKGDKTLFQGFSINGEVFVNLTPHKMTFLNPELSKGGTYVKWFELEGAPELAKKLSAKMLEKVVKEEKGIEYVDFVYDITPQGEELRNLATELGIHLISSIISADAYGYPVVSPVLPPELVRAPPEKKMAYPTRFHTKIK